MIFMFAIILIALVPYAQAWISQASPQLHGPCALLSVANDFNVVLRPSDDDAAFDSLKVGSAKVHRYSLDTDPESEVEYVMWYHGRSKAMDSDKSLPPLSTGRIGRATSKV